MAGKTIALGAVLLGLCFAGAAGARERWTPAQAQAWYDKQSWLVGSNYTPASAINDIRTVDRTYQLGFHFRLH